MFSPLCPQSTGLVLAEDTVICSIELLGIQGYNDGTFPLSGNLYQLFFFCYDKTSQETST